MAAECEERAFLHHLDDHGNRLLNCLQVLWKDKKYCDLVIIAQSRALPVHACVMAAFSPKIASLISKQNLQNKVGNLNMYTVKVRFDYDVIESLVTAIYTGIFQPVSKYLKEMLSAAQWLEITELIAVIKNHIDSPAKEKYKCLHPAVNSSLSSTPAGQSLEAPKLKDGLDCIDTFVSADLNVNTATRNEKLNSNQKDTANQTISTHFPETKREAHEVSKCDKQTNTTSYKQVKKNTRLLKPKNLHNSVALLSEKGKHVTKRKGAGRLVQKKSATISKQKGKSFKDPANKLVDEMSDEQGGENLVEKDHLKEEVEAGENLIEEIHNEDAVKDELDLIMGNVGFIKCKKCYVKFTDLDVYNIHVQNHPTLECNHCGQKFFSKFSLGKHIRSVHFGTEHLVCHYCKFVAKSQVELRKHSVDAHNDGKPFPCPHKGCKFTAVKHSQVLKHMIIHSEEKEFVCDKCSVSFLRQTGLMNHQRTCYQLQEFLCDLCGQSFNHKHSMKKHRKVIHFGEKPYTCSICSNSFGDHRNLHRHMRIHENSFPYVCPVCKQQFRHSNSLKAHMATKHKDHPENIQLNLNKALQGSLGGVNYKRILKNDLINTITSRVELGGDCKKRKRQHKIKREVQSPTQMFESATFAGEFFIPAEDSSFDISSSSDLEYAMNAAQQADCTSCNLKPHDLNGGSRTIHEEVGEISHAVSDQNISSSSFIAPQMLQVASSSWAHRVKSPQYVTSTLPSPLSLQQLDMQKSLLSTINISDPREPHPGRTLAMPNISDSHAGHSGRNLMVRNIFDPREGHPGRTLMMPNIFDSHEAYLGRTLTVPNNSDSHVAHPDRTLTMPNISEHTFTHLHPGLQKLQQTSQQALEKYLSQNRSSNELSKVRPLPNVFRAAPVADPHTLPSPPT